MSCVKIKVRFKRCSLLSVYNFTRLPRMTFEDFCKYFHQTAICRGVNTSILSLTKTWHEGLSHGAWKKPDRAGGCPNNKDTFLKNPQVGCAQSPARGNLSSKPSGRLFTVPR